MKTRLFILLARLALLFVQTAAATRPNIVIIAADDSGEAREPAAQHPDLAGMLEAAWKKLNAGMVAPLWGGHARIPR